ncbi:MAG TPA: biotin carboxylase [Amaricoccus sp.]|uniref:biotin carboxylase n=1 Tax=Amaricoccus sp. TaxID=1872485 RepID=UPI002D154016|nr:biotin carboxylase [Amaricoccus sp.]HMQ93760.1 biotin carboxylase [Amaricoccus sp.]HMR52955.1 biotin carboxylase [Amaricoccus sp.]HMR59476.1 biotin carboxylase [Amaricoccus sp.]HMT99850.1 biotin carboxylase [Amaricoccus sp.]
MAERRKPMPKKTLKNISEIRRYFHTNQNPIYFVSATNFNLLGLDEWVKNFKYICYIDCFDGQHPNVMIPSEVPHDEFQSIEDINNYLLQHKEVIDYVEKRGGKKPKFVFLMFDEKTEKLAREIGGEVWFPKARLRTKCDNKIETVRIGNKAGVPSVPNTLSEVRSYKHLRELCEKAGIGHDLVLQSAFGDSGHTTFFIKSEADFRKHEHEIVGEGEIKIMKRIDCRGSAIEACATRQGTIVGPLMTELVGFRELTPYRGGWCGNEIFATAFPPKTRQKARELTFKFGEQLRKEGYRGYFELDFLIDKKTGDIWLGELNPRITGASSMTNHAAFAHADAPLFLFHLLEFSGKDFELDVEALNARWADPDMIDSWSQMVIKHTEDTVDIITAAPPSGIYRMLDDGRVVFDRFDYHRRAVESEREAFFLRIQKPGDYRYEGADLGILVTRGRSMTNAFALTDRSKKWIDGIKNAFSARPLPSAQALAEPAFKIM